MKIKQLLRSFLLLGLLFIPKTYCMESLLPLMLMLKMTGVSTEDMMEDPNIKEMLMQHTLSVKLSQLSLDDRKEYMCNLVRKNVSKELQPFVTKLDEHGIYDYMFGANIAIARSFNEDPNYKSFDHILDQWHKFGGSGNIEDFYVELGTLLSFKKFIAPHTILCEFLTLKKELRQIEQGTYQAIIQSHNFKKRKELLKPASYGFV